MQRIRAYLASVPPAERDQVFFKNPSYVFFQPLESQSLTYSGAEVTAGRTIATDKFLFPKGVLGFFAIEEPTFAGEADLNASGWEAKPRFVFDQDTGGAIRGGGRVDLYMGQGPGAARKAGVMKRDGKLWGLAPKQVFLDRLSPR
jgi:membrane-bound lytic murein transglycosylase A